MTELIYCADGNRRFVEIALNNQYHYGAQLPNTVYFPPVFIDQNWRDPKRAAYMESLQTYKPRLATVLDWEREDQLGEVLDWAEEAAQYVSESVIIIPKVIGGAKRLPRRIGGKDVRLGYSAATSFAGTPVNVGEFRGWPVHCLGGSPSRQMYLKGILPAMESADGNFIQNMARLVAAFYSPSLMGRRRGWPTLREAGVFVEIDAPYLAFALTCIGVPMAWRGADGLTIWDAQLEFLRSVNCLPERRQEKLFA